MSLAIIPFRRRVRFVAPVYLDANFLVASYLRGHVRYQRARYYLFELFRQRTPKVISALAMDEAWWGLLGAWYEYDHPGNRFSANLLKRSPMILDAYSARIRNFTDTILHWHDTTLLPDTTMKASTLIEHARDNLIQHRLAPRDAFHLAAIELKGAAGLITCDSDFDRLVLPFDLTLYKF
jgi:predicted nucleic acid-binding protein